MSFIYVLIFIFLFMNKGGSNQVLDLIKSVDLSAILPILENFGVSPQIKDFINSDNFKEVLSGNLDLSKILPILTPLISSFIGNTNTFSNKDNDLDNLVSERLSPIKDIANEYVTNTFEEIFS